MNRKPALATVTLWLVFLVKSAHAQERVPEEKREPIPIHRFFDRPVDYWHRGLSYDPPAAAKAQDSPGDPGRPSRPTGRNDWGQVVRQPDGSFSYYELPKPLVDVLEDPSPDKIRAYFEWKLGRTQKILRAAEAMKEYRSQVAPPRELPVRGDNAAAAAGTDDPGAPTPIEKPAPPLPDRPIPAARQGYSITYFHRAGCHHCETQDAVLAAWLKDKPGITLEVLEFGSKPELWRHYNVRGTPSLVIESKAPRKSVFLEGLAREDALDQALVRVGNGPSDPKLPKEGAR